MGEKGGAGEKGGVGEKGGGEGERRRGRGRRE